MGQDCCGHAGYADKGKRKKQDTKGDLPAQITGDKQLETRPKQTEKRPIE